MRRLPGYFALVVKRVHPFAQSNLVPISGLARANEDAFCVLTVAGSVHSFVDACKVSRH